MKSFNAMVRKIGKLASLPSKLSEKLQLSKEELMTGCLAFEIPSRGLQCLQLAVLCIITPTQSI